MPSARFPPIPSVAHYKAALNAARGQLSDGQLAMLRAQYFAPERTLTASQLAAAANYRSYHGANLQYGRMSLLLRHVLGYWEDGVASYVLSWFVPPGAAGNHEWLFVMHEAVAEALTELGWFDQFDNTAGLHKGRKKLYRMDSHN
jgi:5-methylcytosine-specific restriction enzyme A